VALILGIVAIVGMIAISVQKTFDGVTVFYGSYFDLVMSYLAFIIVCVILMALSEDEQDTPRSMYMALFWIALAYNYVKAFSDNIKTPFYALCVGTGRMTFGYLIAILAVINAVTLFFPKRTNQSTQEWQTEKLSHLASLGACAWFLNRLVGRNPCQVQYACASGDIDDEFFYNDSFDDDCVSDSDYNFHDHDPNDNYHHQREPKHALQPLKSFNPSEILGVSQNASQEQIKQAYRDMSRLYHPDKTSHLGVELPELAHEKMKQINRANQMLKQG